MSLLKDINDVKIASTLIEEARTGWFIVPAGRKNPIPLAGPFKTKKDAEVEIIRGSVPDDIKVIAVYGKEVGEWGFEKLDPPSNESLLKELVNKSQIIAKNQADLKKSDASDAGKSDVVDKAIASQDIAFNLMRNTINTDGKVSGSDIANYIEKAEELNDEVDTVPFGLETDDGQIVKVYVNAEQADKFEDAMKTMLGMEDDIEEAISRLTTEFDIVDVVWPTSEEEEDETDPDADLSIDDTSMLDPDDDEDFADDQYDVVASVDDDETEQVKSDKEDEATTSSEDDEEASEDDEELDDEDKPKKRKKKKPQPAEPAEDEGTKQESKMTIGSKFLERVLQEAEDRDGVKDNFNIPLDSQARALAAKLKLPFAKRLVAFHTMCGVPGRYLNSEEAESTIASAADMLRKKVAIRRAFLSLYDGLANAKGFTIPQNDAMKEAKRTKEDVEDEIKALDKKIVQAGKDGTRRSLILDMEKKLTRLRNELKLMREELEQSIDEAVPSNDKEWDEAELKAWKKRFPKAKSTTVAEFRKEFPNHKYRRQDDVVSIKLFKEDTSLIKELDEAAKTKPLLGADPDKVLKAKEAVKKAKKALVDHTKHYDGGTGMRAKQLQAEIDKAQARLKKLTEEMELDEAKQKRGSFIQKLLETVMVALGLPETMITVTGPSAVGTGIYKTAELIEQDSTLERALRLLATRLGLKANDAQEPVAEAKMPEKQKPSGALTAKQKRNLVKDFKEWSGGFGPAEAADKIARFVRTELPADLDAQVARVYLKSLAEGLEEDVGVIFQEAINVGNDDYANAVVNLVAALGIPDVALTARRPQVVQSLRRRKSELRNRAAVLTMMTRLENLLSRNTAPGAGEPDEEAMESNAASQRSQ